MAIGEIIGAGLGLIGSLFGKKKQKTETSVNYQQMVDSATAAGFNPLTAIRNGGSAGFTTTTSPTVSQIPDALANFGGVLGSALEKRLDPIEAKKREIDTLMTDVQLKEARALSKRPASFYQPLEWSGTKVSNQFVPRLGAKSHKQAAAIPANNKPGEGVLVGGDNPKVSSLGMNNGRYGIFHFPGVPDAEEFEKVYGDNEANSIFTSVLKYGTDIPYSIYRNGKSAYEDYAPKVKGWVAPTRSDKSRSYRPGGQWKPPSNNIRWTKRSYLQ